MWVLTKEKLLNYLEIFIVKEQFIVLIRTALLEKILKTSKNVKIHNFALGDKVEKRKILFNDIDLTTSLSEINKHSFYLKVKI